MAAETQMPQSAPPWQFAADQTLESGRTLLRLINEADLPALMAVNGDDHVTQFLPYVSWQTPDDAQAWYQRMVTAQAAGTAWQFVVVDKATGPAIGSCLLFRFEAGSARAELGYVLGRAHWGRGLMHEALKMLIGHAFGDMGLRRIEAEVDPRNAASGALLMRLGFAKEGLRRQRWVNKGVPTDVEAYGLLRHEWQGGRAGDA